MGRAPVRGGKALCKSEKIILLCGTELTLRSRPCTSHGRLLEGREKDGPHDPRLRRAIEQ